MITWREMMVITVKPYKQMLDETYESPISKLQDHKPNRLTIQSKKVRGKNL